MAALRLRLTGLMFVALLLAGGCGDDAGGDDTEGAADATPTITTSSLTKAEFLARGNAICADGRRQFLPRMSAYIERRYPDEEVTPEIFADAIHVVFLPMLETQIEEIRELGAPRGDEQTIETFLDTLQAKIDVIETWQRVPSRFPVDREFRPAGELAREYGLLTCGYGEGPTAGA